MATVWFVKKGMGENGEFIATSCAVDAAAVAASIGAHVAEHFERPPERDKHTAARWWSDPQYVVVQISPDETCDAFPRAGYYDIKMSFHETVRLLGLE